MGNDAKQPGFSVRLRWRDLDNQGHVYHATYLTLLDEARTQFFKSLGFTEPGSYVLVRIELDYLKELTLSSPEIEVRFAVEKVGTSSLRLKEEMYSAGELKSQSQSVVVLWDNTSRGARSLSEEERQQIDLLAQF